MTLIAHSMDVHGTAPRTNFDIAHTQDDGEDLSLSWGELFDAEYDTYIRPANATGSKPQRLS